MSPSDVTRATSIACEIRLATQQAEPSRALAHRLVIPEQAGCESQRDEGQLRRDLEVAGSKALAEPGSPPRLHMQSRQGSLDPGTGMQPR